MSETIPIIVGVVLSVILVRWIYSIAAAVSVLNMAPVDNRNPDAPRGPPLEAIRQLQGMFPNIPEAVIRSELVRAGSVQAAIERLLVVSERYPIVRQAVRAPVDEAPTKNTLRDVLSKPVGELEPMHVDAATWSKDQAVREKLLLHRKQEMIQKARR